MVGPNELIERLAMKPLPQEGGYYVETYKSSEIVAGKALPSRFGGSRAFGTAIYYLLTPDTFSAMHRLRSDEVFHFYLGSPVEMLQLKEGEDGRLFTLGSRIIEGMVPQLLVPAGVWQGSRLRDGGSFALLGTTVCPAFEFEDYEHGDRVRLSQEYPRFQAMISRLTR